jgi:hypothetical protein
VLDLIAMAPAHYFLGAGAALAIAAVLVSRRRRIRRGPTWLRWVPLPVLAALGGLGFTGALWLAAPQVPSSLTSNYPRNCAQARAMGYGNARIGQPGYFRHLDADGDGISCEPLPWSRR